MIGSGCSGVNGGRCVKATTGLSEVIKSRCNNNAHNRAWREGNNLPIRRPCLKKWHGIHMWHFHFWVSRSFTARSSIYVSFFCDHHTRDWSLSSEFYVGVYEQRFYRQKRMLATDQNGLIPWWHKKYERLCPKNASQPYCVQSFCT